MKTILKKLILQWTPKKLRHLYLQPYEELLEHGRISYSQEGEDLILARWIGTKTDGFYVDVGAHHPKRFSNTYFFYRLGWRGINIDAMPGSMDAFRQIRPRDINIEAAVADTQETLVYYGFNDPALNGFSHEISLRRSNIQDYQIIFQKELATQTLAKILDQYLPPQQPIDFLSVDVEGLDLKVLSSNDWTKYRPRFILAEDLENLPLARIAESRLVQYLSKLDYQPIAKSRNTLFLVEQSL